MIVAVIGSGGREHAIAWKLKQSQLVEKVYVLPGNGGTEVNVQIDPLDFAAIEAFCRDKGVELLFVGPEAPLAAGIVDYFADTPLQVFGPERQAAILESSKIWSKHFMQKYGVATAAFWEFSGEQMEAAQQKIEQLAGNCVLKYDGLAAGKGVYVCSDITEAKAALSELQINFGTEADFLIEECIAGREISILAFTDGKDYKLLQPSVDHKQLLAGDKGLNTGGMGAFCPVPFYNEEIKQAIVEQIVQPTLQGIQAENFNYRGVIYFGIMLTESGPKLLEYNVRLGDPETEVVLPALKSDLVELILACFEGNLSQLNLEFHPGYFVDVVLASGGYPKSYQKGYQITGLPKLQPGTLAFMAGVKKQEGNLLTDGGRVLNIVASGNTLAEATEKVYSEVKQIEFEACYYRPDIAQRESFKIDGDK